MDESLVTQDRLRRTARWRSYEGGNRGVMALLREDRQPHWVPGGPGGIRTHDSGAKSLKLYP